MFRKLFHPEQNDSGLIPPESSEPAWKESEATPAKFSWKPEPTKPTTPTLEERRALALEEAVNYLRDGDANENKNLAFILELRQDIGRKDANAIVDRAARILYGSHENDD